MSAKRRVVITGIGATSPFGVGVDVFWNSLKNGKSGIKVGTLIDVTNHYTKRFGECSNYNPLNYFNPKEAKRLDRYIQMGVVAAHEAYKDSGLTEDSVDAYRFGVCAGSAAGGMNTTEIQHLSLIQKGHGKCSPYTVPMQIVNMGAGKIAIDFKAKGPNKAVVTACATGAHCIGDAFRTIQYNDADVMLAGGMDAPISNIAVSGFTAARTLSRRNDEPEKASRPYDRDRDGFVMSEGGGILVLEELEHALNRNAKIYCEIAGFGATCDAYDIVAPDPDGNGAAEAMRISLREAGLSPSDINYINAHGTSTHVGDLSEIKAINNVFKDCLTKGLMISSTKSMHGHLLGGSGAVESIACIKAMQEGIVPPTINLDNPDEALPEGIDLVPNTAKKANVNITLNNSFGFGGHNASLIFKKFVK
jgi:3-oxoacyl-[acyl-carrier-protein] synthase II